MALVETPLCEKGWEAQDFKLTAIDGNTYSLADVKGINGLVIMFICNHCPYVKAIADRLPQVVKELKEHGVGTVAIMSNDVETYPEDSFENMSEFSHQHQFNFPYLIDETQEVAKAYRAVCTPDFFGFDKNMELKYRGRLDSAGKNHVTPETENELLEAMINIAITGEHDGKEMPSVGCSIKWK